MRGSLRTPDAGKGSGSALTRINYLLSWTLNPGAPVGLKPFNQDLVRMAALYAFLSGIRPAAEAALRLQEKRGLGIQPPDATFIAHALLPSLAPILGALLLAALSRPLAGLIADGLPVPSIPDLRDLRAAARALAGVAFGVMGLGPANDALRTFGARDGQLADPHLLASLGLALAWAGAAFFLLMGADPLRKAWAKLVAQRPRP